MYCGVLAKCVGECNSSLIWWKVLYPAAFGVLGEETSVLPEYNPDSTLGRGCPVACSMTFYLMGIPMA